MNINIEEINSKKEGDEKNSNDNPYGALFFRIGTAKSCNCRPEDRKSEISGYAEHQPESGFTGSR